MAHFRLSLVTTSPSSTNPSRSTTTFSNTAPSTRRVCLRACGAALSLADATSQYDHYLDLHPPLMDEKFQSCSKLLIYNPLRLPHAPAVRVPPAASLQGAAALLLVLTADYCVCILFFGVFHIGTHESKEGCSTDSDDLPHRSHPLAPPSHHPPDRAAAYSTTRAQTSSTACCPTLQHDSSTRSAPRLGTGAIACATLYEPTCLTPPPSPPRTTSCMPGTASPLEAWTCRAPRCPLHRLLRLQRAPCCQRLLYGLPRAPSSSPARGLSPSRAAHLQHDTDHPRHARHGQLLPIARTSRALPLFQRFSTLRSKLAPVGHPRTTWSTTGVRTSAAGVPLSHAAFIASPAPRPSCAPTPASARNLDFQPALCSIFTDRLIFVLLLNYPRGVHVICIHFAHPSRRFPKRGAP
ncbi:hypothetical protein B0H13DRAFT_2383004 [Mycena leptocephala]|nr:hypothetical protein B0H13DRAFT_2383004 [Mycena leptocephala]